MKTKLLFPIYLFLIFNICFAQSKVTQIDSSKTNAVKSATEWLNLIDNGKYDKSWETASKIFKNAISKEKWNGTLKNILLPFGAYINRELLAAKLLTKVPGAPDGEYFVLQFRTKFKNKSNAIETITPMKESDGVWRISGYYIK